MSVYVISDTVPQDPQAWETYISLAPATIEKYGGRYLARGGHIDTIEGSWTPAAIVLVEFPDAEAVKAWYSSAEYAKALKVRDKALRRNLIMPRSSYRSRRRPTAPERVLRAGSVKRVVAAVGEGAQTVAALHAYLAKTGERPALSITVPSPITIERSERPESAQPRRSPALQRSEGQDSTPLRQPADLG